MAMMEPVSGLSEFLTVVTELRFGQRSPYPFYCALLYTVAEGADAALARYIEENWDELDAMTGDRCLVFTVGDAHPEPAAGHRPFSPQEIYRIADHLGVRASALPCAAFFSNLDESREVIRVRLADYVRWSPDRQNGPTFTRAFRAITTALTRCSDHSQAERIDCLRDALVREHESAFPSESPTPADRLDSTASAVGSVEKVLVSGTTIATTVLRVLGIAT
jgi:hypothetical protein